MKTSKKILSLFLAVVMVITTCSVGFTAFAADSYKAENNAYWNDAKKAKEVYLALDTLVNEVVPAIANNEKIKPALEKLGMTVDGNTTIQDIIVGVSPKIMSALGNSGSGDSVTKKLYEERGYKDPEFLYNELSSLGVLDYLNDSNAAIGFFSLYQLCLEWKGSGDKEKSDYAEETLKVLQPILETHINAFEEVATIDDNNNIVITGKAESKQAIDDYKSQLEGITFDDNLTLYDLENYEISEGVLLKDVHNIDKRCNTQLAYDNLYLDFEGAPIQIDNVAADIFYGENQNLMMGMFYLYLANLGGAKVLYDKEDPDSVLTPSNYQDIISKKKSYSKFCTEKNYPDNDRSKSAYERFCLQEVYNTIFDGSTVASTQQGTGEFASPYYNCIAIGALEQTKSYDTSKYSSAAEFVVAQQVKDDQIKDLYTYLKAKKNNTFDKYVQSADCKFSSYNKKFFADWFKGKYFSEMIDWNLRKCKNEDAAVTMFKELSFSNKYSDEGFEKADGRAIRIQYFDKTFPSNNGRKVFSDIANYLLPSAIILQETGKKSPDFGMYGTVNIAAYYESKNNIDRDLIRSLLLEKIGDVKYEYSKVAVSEKMAFDVANASINNIFDGLLNNQQIMGLLNQLLGNFLETITIEEVIRDLHDLWYHLYDDPVGTIIDLLPDLAVLLDEAVVPLLLNDNPKADNLYGVLFDMVVPFLESEGNTNLAATLRSLVQENGSTKIGVGNLAFDLNKAVPAILNWINGNDSKALDYVDTYDFSEFYVDSAKIRKELFVDFKDETDSYIKMGKKLLLKNELVNEFNNIALEKEIPDPEDKEKTIKELVKIDLANDLDKLIESIKVFIANIDNSIDKEKLAKLDADEVEAFNATVLIINTFMETDNLAAYNELPSVLEDVFMLFESVLKDDEYKKFKGFFSDYEEIYDKYVDFINNCDKVPVFTNIYVADRAIYGFHIEGKVAKAMKKSDSTIDQTILADGLDEAVRDVLSFITKGVEDYLAIHKDDVRYGLDGNVANKGLNNIFVALPQIIDTVGKNFINKYKVNSDWNYAYKISTYQKGDKFYTSNTALEKFKDLAVDGSSDDFLKGFTDIVIGEWVNALLDIVNDTLQDPNNTITSNIPVVQGLLSAIGGLGETSIITDVLDGLFQLKRCDDAAFVLKKRNNGFNGFSTESGIFLLSNIVFEKRVVINDNKSVYEKRGLIPYISALTKSDSSSQSASTGTTKSNAPLLANSSKANTSSVGTDYEELLSDENAEAANALVETLDNLLSSLLKNTTVNGFALDKTDGILSAVATVASSYFGSSNTNDIVKLLNNYLYYIVGETKNNPGAYGKIGILPKKNGKVNEAKVYTSANLSNLVIQTYSLVENIVDYLFNNQKSGLLKGRDQYGFVSDAVNGIISPDSVAIRLSNKYNKTASILLDKKRLHWNSFKVEISDANQKTGSYTKDYLEFGFANGDKKEFYNALGESLSGIAGIIGAVLTTSYSDKYLSSTGNYYSKLVYPIFTSIGNAIDPKTNTVMSVGSFAAATPSEQLVNGILTPVSSALNCFLEAPASFVLNLIKGVSALLQDSQIKALVNGAIAPITYHVDGLAAVVKNLSPIISDLIKSKLVIKVTLPEKDIAVTLINKLLASLLKKDANWKIIPSINWAKIAAVSTPGEVLLLVYGFVVDLILNNDFIRNIIDSLAPGLTDILNNISAVQLLRILNEIIQSVQSPTEIYWTFAEYAGKLSDKFVYPAGITATAANNAVDQLDELVKNVFPLLNTLGVTDIQGIDSLINDKLYTNEILTSLSKAVYGALSKGTAGAVFKTLGVDVSPSGFADYLMDKSYGQTFSSAAKTLRNKKSWDKVKTLNWGFTNGSSKAQTGFINGLAAALRPFNNVLAVLLAEGKLDPSKLDLKKIVGELNLKGSTPYAADSEYGGTLEYKLKKGKLLLTVRSNAKVASGKPAARNVIRMDLNKIIDSLDLSGDIYLGSNGYENAVIPILEAFMCKNVKTYKQYRRDYKKAKDNLLIDVVTPVLDLVKDIAKNPFNTVTKILPNVAYFIDNNGLVQAIANLLAPITSEEGVLGILASNGLDIDELIKELTGKSLGKIITDALNIKGVKFKLELNNLAGSNIQDIVVPLVNAILKKNNIGIEIPELDFAKLASHGKLRIVKSKAMNDEGKYTTRQIQANQGEVLVAVLRYVSDVLIKNAVALKDLITNIDAIKNNETIKNIVAAVFNSLAVASKDDIVRAVFYFLTGSATDKFFDYRNFKYKDYKFSFGNMDEDFCRKLAPMLDGLIGGLLEGGLGGLVSEKLYTDDLVAKLATGLYGAIEGVKVGDGSLADLLAQMDIDFTSSNVANLLTDSRYGLTYPAAANVIKSAGSWSNVKAESLKFGVKDRDSFLHAIVAVLRPIFGVVDVLLNDASLNIFNLVKIPGSDGYTSTIVPLLEAFGVYNIKTQYQYREDCYNAYDNVLLDIINPLWDKVEDLLNAPVEMLADILPNLSLFFANDGLLQIVDNLLTPVTALLEALKPIVNVNDVLKAAGLDVPKLLKDKVGLNVKKFDIYDLKGTLKPLVGADNVVNTLNSILGIIKIKGTPLGIVLPEIDWFKLASHGEFVPNATSQAATYGGRIAVIADQDETLIAVLRFVIMTINYKDNYDAIVDLIGGILGDNASDSISDVISQVLGMLKGDPDEVIEQLVDLLKQFA